MIRKKQEHLLPSTLVRVRTLKEILATLDEAGTLEGLPFMLEMVQYCGKRFRVSKRIERTCEEGEKGMRRIRNAVFLENLRCDGSTHGDCQKRCMLFWKDAWLTTSEDKEGLSEGGSGHSQMLGDLPSTISDGRYICQSTELVKATAPLAPINLMTFIHDIRSRTYSIPELIRGFSYAIFLRLRYYLTRKPYGYISGEQAQTPSESLNLQPGEWVQVKTKEEIRETLDAQGMNRGLRFTIDLFPYCGGTHRVLGRMEKMIHEPTGKLIDVKDTVILENSTCKGCNTIWGSCPRENYNFWREIWLRRIPKA
ncbi:MAG: hypothetical protein JSV17_14045 [Candidatus Aminicenantes bacterium]|nr:MAG: hypothetical protein JSV17_14045 [Candidatus Aminicenantes bacterium]